MSSPYRQHVDKWKNCLRCPLHEGRLKVVHVRGYVPCDILFVGEAPGESENVVGQPFVGPAGRLLDEIVRRSLGTRFRTAYTNLVGCIPREPDGTGKLAQPDDEHIKACAPRLQEVVKLCEPKLIVCVGSLSEDWLRPGDKHSVKFHRPVNQIHIRHPASILRANVAQRGLEIQRCIVSLANAVEGL